MKKNDDFVKVKCKSCGDIHQVEKGFFFSCVNAKTDDTHYILVGPDGIVRQTDALDDLRAFMRCYKNKKVWGVK
jgi:hypothetical protein